MHKILAAAAALGLLALPMQASAQTSSEPTTKTAPAGQEIQGKGGCVDMKAPDAKTRWQEGRRPKVSKAKEQA